MHAVRHGSRRSPQRSHLGGARHGSKAALEGRQTRNAPRDAYAAPDEALRFQQQHYAIDYLENKLDYVVVDICERNIDRIMIPKERT